jgi:hypothetical protein
MTRPDPRTLDRLNEDEIRRRVHASTGKRLLGGMTIMVAMYATGYIIGGLLCGSIFAVGGVIAAAALVAPVLWEVSV